MEHGGAAAHGRIERRAVVHVALGDLDVEAQEVAPVAAAANERANAFPGREQRARYRGAEEAVRARDEVHCPKARAWLAGCARSVRACNHAGSTISVNAMLTPRPTVSSTPMLAVPTCDENARMPKLATVVV